MSLSILLLMFTGGMFVITGLSLGAGGALIAFLWGRAKIRSWKGNDGSIKITVPNGHRGRSDMHTLNKGLKYVEDEFNEQGIVNRVMEQKPPRRGKKRAQRDAEKRRRNQK